MTQPTPGSEASPAEPEWVRPEEVPLRADEWLRRLEEARPGATATSTLDRIERSLPVLGRDLDAALRRAADAMAGSASLAEFDDLRREIAGIAEPFSRWKDELGAEAKRVAQSLDTIARGERVWSTTSSRPETLAAGPGVARRVEASLSALRDAQVGLRAWRDRVLVASDGVIDRADAAAALGERLQAASRAERDHLFEADHPPLWSRGLGAELRAELPRVPEEMRAYAASTAAYVERDLRPLIVQGLFALVLLLVLGRLATRARSRPGGEVDSRTARLIECPYAGGLLIALLATPLFHPFAPRRFLQVAAMLLLFPAARIVTHVSQKPHRRLFAGLFSILLLDRLGSAVAPLPALSRAIFLLGLAIGFTLALGVSRHLRREGATAWLRGVARFALWGLGLAFVAEIGGWTNLSMLVGRGILAGAIAAFYIYAATIVLSALLGLALGSRTLRRSRLIERNTSGLQQQSEAALRALGLGLWVYLLLTALGLRSAVTDALEAAFGARVTVGALTLSVGGVLAFVLTMGIALILARVVNRVLEDDVYPRTNLPRGVPYALSTLVRYGVFTLGFLFALAAAGVEPGQVTIMVGGLGIGIGLGLQDLVKNFASGLTLLFERRLNVGDTLEVPGQGISGRVLSIGMRASVVRTWSGAEVVIPNSDLTSSAITNWTLSDRLCRLEVPVGVAYGNDPERVAELLLEAARSGDRVVADPPPAVIFKGFGDSSLDFLVRAWTDQGYDQALALTGRLGIAVARALREAGIEIPFPQRDLHLATVSEQARGALSGTERRSGERPRREPGP